ncbi:hypothetical protein [Rhizobium leguminosarum]|uniref:hypothetical protein n=1 Tax=Rhizobium leguminosarum TaxID=384 RepID=UPI001C956BC0|nr:hypothetical protein [Rhizobium leguminosarum]MBY5329231.1 hypothetical protein [Rhizobium leguminosarum]
MTVESLEGKTDSNLGAAMQIVSAEQFIEGLIAALSLDGKKSIQLDNPKLDEQFSKAYNELLDNAENLGVVPDFVIAPDAYHGDSTCLRDAILAVRDLKSVALHNPKFVRLSIDVTSAAAEKTLDDSRIPGDALRKMAKKYLTDVAQ